MDEMFAMFCPVFDAGLDEICKRILAGSYHCSMDHDAPFARWGGDIPIGELPAACEAFSGPEHECLSG